MRLRKTRDGVPLEHFLQQRALCFRDDPFQCTPRLRECRFLSRGQTRRKLPAVRAVLVIARRALLSTAQHPKRNLSEAEIPVRHFGSVYCVENLLAPIGSVKQKRVPSTS